MAERNTAQQEVINNVLEKAEHPLTPQEILIAAQKKISQIGIATVYRRLKKLVDEEKVTLIQIASLPPRYESTAKKHHHHFACRKCKSVIDIQGCVPEIEKIAPKKFIVESHEITLYGLCNKCR